MATPDYTGRRMTDKQKIEVFVAEGIARDPQDAYYMLLDMGDYSDDGTFEPEEDWD